MIPLIGGLKLVTPRMKVILTLEAAITDVLVIVVAMSIMGVMSSGDASIGKAIGSILSAFLVSGFIGLLGGFIWLEILSRYMEGQPFTYMVTLVALLGVYAITEMLVKGTGGGAIAALLFGLTLANGGELANLFKHNVKDYSFDENISKLHDEISFFVRTFFFISGRAF